LPAPFGPAMTMQRGDLDDGRRISSGAVFFRRGMTG